MSASIADRANDPFSRYGLETIKEDLELQIESVPPPPLGSTRYIDPYPASFDATPAGAEGGTNAPGPAGNTPPPLTPLRHNLRQTLRPAITSREAEFQYPAAPRFRLDITRRFRENLTRTNVIQFGINAGTAIAAGVLGHVDPEVRLWSWAPTVVYGTNDIVDLVKFEPRNNRHLDGYFTQTRLASSLRPFRQDSSSTKAYFLRQRQWDGFLTGCATVALAAGASSTVAGWTFNSIVHGLPTAETFFLTLSRLCSAKWSNPNEASMYEEWINWIRLFKSTRVFFRGFLTTLPHYAPQTILTALGVAGGVALTRNLAIGDFIEELAQYIHFKAYDEQGYLTRSHALQMSRREGAAFRPDPESGNVLHDSNAGPATRVIEQLFWDDLRGVGTRGNFVGELIKEPCGWMAIAHKIMQF